MPNLAVSQPVDDLLRSQSIQQILTNTGAASALHSNTHSPTGSDSLASYYASKNGEGLSYVVVDISANNKVTNGYNLFAAYSAAKLLTPNNSSLSNTNRSTVIVPPGDYDLQSQVLIIDSDYVNVLAAIPGSVNITGSTLISATSATIFGLKSLDRNVIYPYTSPYDNGSVSGSVQLNAGNGQYQKLTATSSITITPPINGVEGSQIEIKIVVSGAGATLDFSNISIPSDSAVLFPKLLTQNLYYIAKVKKGLTTWGLVSLIGGFYN